MQKRKARPERNDDSKHLASNCTIHVKTSNLSGFVCLSDLKDHQKRFQKICEIPDNHLKEPYDSPEECKVCMNRFCKSPMIMMAIIGTTISGSQ